MCHIYWSLGRMVVIGLIAFSFQGCSEGGGVNIFSLEDDKALGAQIAASIAGDPAQFPLIDPEVYPKMYGFLYGMRDSILATQAVVHAQDFEWQLHVIHNDTIVNAFCTPGGYIYIYTGLLKFMSNEAELAGVLAHEMAHADLRHSTDQLTKAYGISLLLSLLVGENGSAIADIAAGLSQLAFSRSDEAQADAYAVSYLCGTQYNADEAAAFFEKINTQEGTQIPDFLSTHPNPDDRVEAIREKSTELACPGEETYAQQYVLFLKELPK